MGELTNEEFEQWIDIMSRIKWTSLNAGDRRRLSEKLEHKKVRIQPVNPGAPLTRYGWIMKVEYGATNEPKELEIFEPVMNGELSVGATEVFSTHMVWASLGHLGGQCYGAKMHDKGSRR